MCRIVATRKGYKKEGSFTEVMVKRDSDYATVARHAATTLELQDEDDDGGELSLFRVDGTIIPRGLVDVGGREWTLERYLRSIGRTASQLKLGVGYRADVCSIDITLPSQVLGAAGGNSVRFFFDVPLFSFAGI